jgi:two-component system response regulator AtoC
MRVGGHQTRTIQTRILSVANRDLREQVAEGTFRLDFLYRINAITFNLPPLRNRAEDIPQIANYLIGQHARIFCTQPQPLSRRVLRLMQKFDWPGNIRQLDNLIRSYVLMGNEDALITELLDDERPTPHDFADIDVSQPLSLKQITKQATHELEHQIILKVLKAHNWNRQKTAKWLKISYRSLLYKINEVETSEHSAHSAVHARPNTPLDPSTGHSSLLQ